MDLIWQVDEQPVEIVAVAHRLPDLPRAHFGDDPVQAQILGELDLDAQPRLKRDDESLTVALLRGGETVYGELAVMLHDGTGVARQRLIQTGLVVDRREQREIAPVAVVDDDLV